MLLGSEASAGYFNIDAFRYGIERMEPAHYLRTPYFERWLATIEFNLIAKGPPDRRRAGRQDRNCCEHPGCATSDPACKARLPPETTPGAAAPAVASPVSPWATRW